MHPKNYDLKDMNEIKNTKFLASVNRPSSLKIQYVLYSIILSNILLYKNAQKFIIIYHK